MGFFDSDESREGEGGVDDWLMSYADMITLMVCFFAMFLAVSVPKQESMEEARKEVAEIFADKRDAKKGESPSIFDKEDVQKMDTGTGGGGVLDNSTPTTLAAVMERYRNNGELEIHQEGDKITTIEMNSGLFFNTGSAELNDKGKQVLSDVGANILGGQFPDFTVTVEGHTDDVPISTAQFPSNWELSTARASAVVRYFISLGMAANHMRATGYAHTQPKVPNNDYDGKPIPKNQSTNRRVVIRLERVDLENPTFPSGSLFPKDFWKQ